MTHGRSAMTSALRDRGARLAAVIGILLSAMVLSVTPVLATVQGKEHYSVDYSFTDCGGAVDVVGHVNGVAHFRVGKGDFATAFFAHDRFTVRETWSTGEDFVTLTAHAVFQETRAVPLGGNLFMFSSTLAGQPFTVRDSDGNVIVRDRGSIRDKIIFDTRGDNVPGGTFVADVSSKVSGPHPGLDFDICGYLLG